LVAPAKTYQITMENYAFSSPTLTIEVGSSVTFMNMDTAAHNAVAVDGTFAIPLLNNGESATVTFNKVGVYDYYCEPHKSHMTAQIIVE
ncbi:MAG: plastocyanin/azurin family copper-binding protein, partial [Paenibacillaceae bacterium]